MSHSSKRVFWGFVLLVLALLAPSRTRSASYEGQVVRVETIEQMVQLNPAALAVDNKLSFEVERYSTNHPFWAQPRNARWDRSATDLTNTVSVFMPTNGLGRLIFDDASKGPVNVLWAGAKGTGSGDDTAAIQAALDVVPYQGTVYFPQVSVAYRITSTLTNSRTASMIGEGIKSQIYLASTMSTNLDALVIKPDTRRQGLRISGLWFVPESGTPGRDGIVFDVAATNVSLSGVMVDRNLIRMRNGNSIVVSNPNKDHDAFFASSIIDNWDGLDGGIRLVGFGDSVVIKHNRISTRNGSVGRGLTPAIYVDQIKAADPLGQGSASFLVIEDNNVTCAGGFVHIVSAEQPVIRNNNVEGGYTSSPQPSPQPNGALVDFDGATNAVIYGGVIENNYFGPVTHEFDVLVRINYARDTIIRDNKFSPPGGRIVGGVTNDWRAILIESPALETIIEDNRWPYPIFYGWESKMVNNAGAYTRFFQPNGFQPIPYGTNVTYITPDFFDRFEVTVTDGNPFTIENPTIPGQLSPINVGNYFTLLFRNQSGGSMGTITWGTNYVVENFVPPPAGKSGYVEFQFQNDYKWHEIGWSPLAMTDYAENFVSTVDNAVEARQEVFRLGSPNSSIGNLDLLWPALNGGDLLRTDPEFGTGVNGVTLYDSSGGGKVTLTRQTGQPTAPNKSRVWLKYSYDGTGTYNVSPAPYYGNFYQTFAPGTNDVIVQRFLAKIPVGLRLINAINGTLGTGGTNYWLTPTVGTGEWEYYACLYVSGSAGISGDAGYYYFVRDSWNDATPFDAYIASMAPLRWTTATTGGTGGSSVTVNSTPVASPNLLNNSQFAFGLSGSDVTVTAVDRDWGHFTITSGNAAIDAGVVSYDKIQSVTASRLLGRGSGGAGQVEEIQLGANLSLVGTTLSATTGGGSTNGTPVSVDGGSTLSAANFDDGGDIDFTATGTNVTGVVKPNSVTMATDTTGNFVATVAGTANEVTVSGSGSENAAVTLSLPATIDLGGKTSFEVPNAAAPTVDAFGEVAGDNDAWAASRGALVAYDGTAATRLVGVIASDTPSNLQTIKWNTGGYFTFEDDLSGAGATNGTPVSVDGGTTMTAANFDDGGDINFSIVTSTNVQGTVKANAVELSTDTTGPFVATVAGTANEVSVSGSGAENAAVTLSLPATIDLGGKTSFEVPNAAAPTVDAFGEVAGDNDAWAASRGALVTYDGTAATRLVGVIASDTPSNLQTIKWNTGGYFTFEDDLTSGGGGGLGTNIFVNNSLQQPAKLTNSQTVAWIINGNGDIEARLTNALPDQYYGFGWLPLHAGVSNALTGALHYRKSSDIRTIAWENGTDKNAVGWRANSGVWSVAEYNTNDFTVLEEFVTVDPTGASEDVVTIENAGFNNRFVIDAEVTEFNSTSNIFGANGFKIGSDAVTDITGSGLQVVAGALQTIPQKTVAHFTPLDNQPPAANYATLSTRNSFAILEFNPSTEQAATFVGIIPNDAVLTSGLTFRITWMTTATSGVGRWGVKWMRLNTDLDSDSYDPTPVEVTTATTSATSGITTTTDLTTTNIDSLAAGEPFRVTVYRDTSDASDTINSNPLQFIAGEVRTAN